MYCSCRKVTAFCVKVLLFYLAEQVLLQELQIKNESLRTSQAPSRGFMEQLLRETAGGEALSETLPSSMAVLQPPEQLGAASFRPVGEHPEGKWEHIEGKGQEETLRLWFLSR